MSTPTYELLPWMAEFIDAENPPTSFLDAIKRSPRPVKTLPRLDYDFDAPPGMAAWWWAHTTEEHEQCNVTALVLVQHAMKLTTGMEALVCEWMANRKLGAQAPPGRMPLTPRETSTYRTMMVAATDAEKDTLALFDARLRTLIYKQVPSDAALLGAISFFYELKMLDFFGAFVSIIFERMTAMPAENARDVLGMSANFEFETPEIESMTLASIAPKAAQQESAEKDGMPELQ